MAAGDDKPGNKPPRAPRDGVRHDSRGNAVWQWAVDTGKHAIDSTSRLLKRLEVPGLSIEDDDRPGGKGAGGKAIPTGGSGGASPSREAPRPERVAGYDPYGTRAGAKPPPARPPAAVTKPAAATARPSFWRRLFRRR